MLSAGSALTAGPVVNSGTFTASASERSSRSTTAAWSAMAPSPSATASSTCTRAAPPMSPSRRPSQAASNRGSCRYRVLGTICVVRTVLSQGSGAWKLWSGLLWLASEVDDEDVIHPVDDAGILSGAPHRISLLLLSPERRFRPNMRRRCSK